MSRTEVAPTGEVSMKRGKREPFILLCLPQIMCGGIFREFRASALSSKAYNTKLVPKLSEPQSSSWESGRPCTLRACTCYVADPGGFHSYVP